MSTSCIICQKNTFIKLESVKYPIKNFSVYQCVSCGLAFQNPIPSQKDLQQFYKKIYEKECNFPSAEQAFEEIDEKQERKRFQEINQYKKKGRLLDVGASTGFFLSEVKKHKNWSAYGVEYVEKAAKIARKRFELNMYTGEIFDVPQNNYFDVVTMHSVLEHLPDPIKAIREVHKKLKKNGLFVFNVPNIESFEYLLYKSLHKPFPGFIYEHLYYYTKRSLEMLLTNNGFKIRKITSRHYSHLSLPPKRPLIGLVTFPPKLFLEYTNLGGSFNLGNVLYVYAEKT